MNISRRIFIQQTAAGIAASYCALPAFTQNGKVPVRTLGATGEQVSLLGIGGYHLGTLEDETAAVRFLHEAIDLGVTFLDNAWEYHDGKSEEWMGKGIQGKRNQVFLMTKHHGRDKKTAMQHLEDSLKRLQTDVIDLWQFHEIVYEKDADMIFAPNGGGIEAAIEAKKQGKVKYIGFTGHKHPKFFHQMLDHDYEWDAVQMPLSAFDAHYTSFEQEILPICIERQIGVLAMKTLGSGTLLNSGVLTVDEGINYAMSLPVSTVISGMRNLDELRHNAELARSHKPMTMQQRSQLLEKTKEKALTGEFEQFKSTNRFDGPVGRKLHGVTG